MGISKIVGPQVPRQTRASFDLSAMNSIDEPDDEMFRNRINKKKTWLLTRTLVPHDTLPQDGFEYPSPIKIESSGFFGDP